MATKKTSKPAPAPKEELSLVADDVGTFVEQLIKHDGDIDLKSLFLSAADMAAYMTAVKNKNLVYATKHVPKVIRSVVEEACKGNMSAARMLLDMVGIATSNNEPAPHVAAQFNINTQQPTKLKDIITLEDGKVVIDT